MIFMPACLAHLKPSIAIIYLRALCTLGFCSAPITGRPDESAVRLDTALCGRAEYNLTYLSFA